MRISLRTKTGWKETPRTAVAGMDKAGHYTCPKCGDVLFIAPHGGIYCDRVHTA